MSDLAGRVALVTGAAQGIGRAIAHALAEAGANVIAADLVPGSGGAGLSPLALDVTDEAAVARAVAEIETRQGSLDVLVNNAGIIDKAPVESIDLAQFRRVLEVNVVGAVACAKHVLPGMKRRGFGRIVNLASMQVFLGTPEYSAYSASKAALASLTRVWAAEAVAHGVTVNALYPGFVLTPMGERLIAKTVREQGVDREEAIRRITAPVPIRRFIEPREVAAAALYLTSPLAGAVTGAGIVIDGGVSMHAGQP